MFLKKDLKAIRKFCGYNKIDNEIGVKLVTKKLNGAELLQLIIDGKIKDGDKIERIDRLEIYVYRAYNRYLVDENGIEVSSSRLLAGKFRVLEKPVSFMEAVNSKKRVRVDIRDVVECHATTYEILNTFKSISTIFEILGNCFFSESIIKIINEAKWYIEQDD